MGGSDGRANTEPGRRGLVRAATRQLSAQRYIDPIFYKLDVRPTGTGHECRPRERLLTLVVRFSFAGHDIKTVLWRSFHEVEHDGYLPHERRTLLSAVMVPSEPRLFPQHSETVTCTNLVARSPSCGVAASPRSPQDVATKPPRLAVAPTPCMGTNAAVQILSKLR